MKKELIVAHFYCVRKKEKKTNISQLQSDEIEKALRHKLFIDIY